MRYIVLSPEERKTMMSDIGIKNINELYQNTSSLYTKQQIKVSKHKSEIETENFIKKIAEKNIHIPREFCFLGAGCYNHHIPAAVENIIQRSEFLTPYTPYQPEFSQGTLKIMFEFQTAICKLTEMDIATSAYDGAVALSDAIKIAKLHTKKEYFTTANKIHPDYLEVASTYDHLYTPMQDSSTNQIACIVAQYPDFHGNIPNLKMLRKQADQNSALLIVVINEIIALGLLPAPSEADIVCGDVNSLGARNNFGGPHLGILACKQQYVRKMPGRLCGKTIDRNGNEAYTLTLTAREQHIKRERAISNVCTGQGLTAVAFTIHLSLLGEIGFKKLAKLNHERACLLAEEIQKIPGISVVNTSFFNEFVIELPTVKANLVVRKLLNKKIIAGYPISQSQLLIAATELTTNHAIKILCKALGNKFN